MSFLDLFRTVTPPMTGYVTDAELWLKSLPKHEVFSGGVGIVPDWQSMAPPFRYQESTMMCTAFAGTSIASMLNRKETGQSILFSPLELYIRSNGAIDGNTVQNTANAMETAVMAESSCPWVNGISEWNPLILNLLNAYARAEDKDLSAGIPYAIKGITTVMPDIASIRAALVDSPLMLIVQVGPNYFSNPAPRVSYGSLHAVVAVSVAADGEVLVFDSLEQSASFNGFHYLASDFNILNAFGFLDLPNNWKDVQQTHTDNAFAFVLSRYGKPKDAITETKVDAALKVARTKNPTCATYLDANWEVYVLAITYGGYSVQDVLNDVTNRRRGNGPIFDFNKPKV